jgi:hypothetical protein
MDKLLALFAWGGCGLFLKMHPNLPMVGRKPLNRRMQKNVNVEVDDVFLL